MKTALMSLEEFNQKISQFVLLFDSGRDAWMKAGELLVEMVESDPHIYDYIIQQCPQLSAGILGRFEQMGRKILHPQLLLTASPGFAKLSKLPMSMQERYMEEPVPLVVHTETGTDVLLVMAKDMTKEQAAQAFSATGLRTLGEQKARMVQSCSNAARPIGSNVAPWTIKNGRVIFQQGASLSAGELATLITQLTR